MVAQPWQWLVAWVGKRGSGNDRADSTEGSATRREAKGAGDTTVSSTGERGLSNEMLDDSLAISLSLPNAVDTAAF